jgi:hypothetical protein
MRTVRRTSMKSRHCGRSSERITKSIVGTLGAGGRDCEAGPRRNASWRNIAIALIEGAESACPGVNECNRLFTTAIPNLLVYRKQIRDS